MKLIKKEKIKYLEIICTGSLCSLEEDKPLAIFLSKLWTSEWQKFLKDKGLKNFEPGLLHSFKNEGLVDNNDKLTAEGENVVKTEKSWKELKGLFKLGLLADNKNHIYVISYALCNGDVPKDFEQTDFDFNKFLSGVYKNNLEMEIKDIQLDKTVFIGNYKQVELACVYDYTTKENSYSVNIGNKIINFSENEKSFKLIEEHDAKEILNNAIQNYDNFSVNDITVTLEKESGGELFDGALSQIFEKGSFDISDPDQKYEIKGIRANINQSIIVENIFLKYMLIQTKERYCGYSEVASLLPGFYDLFEKCADVGTKTQNLYNKLIKIANKENKIAYLRLMAYEDLKPDDIQKNYPTKILIDWTNEKHSIDELADIIVDEKDIKSITMLTKYSYKNPATSRAIELLAKSIKKKSNTKLKLITCEKGDNEQSSIAKKFFDNLRESNNVELKIKSAKDIEKIHDRYYRVEKNRGDVCWIKMTGELDAFKYQDDFKDRVTPNLDITENTKANVKELTIVSIDEKGVPDLVKRNMEESK